MMNIKTDLFSSFIMSNFVDFLMPKPSIEKNSSDTIQPIDGR